MTKESKTSIVVALIGVIGGSGGGYFSGLAAIGERVRAVEVKQEVENRSITDRIDRFEKFISQRIDDSSARTRQGHEDIKMDLQGIRGELIGILKERR